jgi:hypothetical protein
MTGDTFKSLCLFAVMIVAVLMIGGCMSMWADQAQLKCDQGYRQECARAANLRAARDEIADRNAWQRYDNAVRRSYQRPAFQQHYHAPTCVNCRWVGPGSGPAHPL